MRKVLGSTLILAAFALALMSKESSAAEKKFTRNADGTFTITEPADQPEENQTAANRARPYKEGMEALAKFSMGHQCGGPDAQLVKQKIAELAEQAREFNVFGIHQQETSDMHTSLAFGFADEALKAKCLDDADQSYRDLFQIYVGAAYSGIRDRARLGIDDVRAARE